MSMGEPEHESDQPPEEYPVECRKCGCRHCPVLYTRPRGKGIVRKRRCRNCGHEFFTVERLGADPPPPPPEG